MVIFSCKTKEEDRHHAIVSKDIVVPKADLVLMQNLGQMYFNSLPFSGRSVVYYNDGSNAEFIDYVDGKRDGFYKKWFENGILSYDSFYVMGKQENLTKTWWKNGNPRSESFYINGVVNGIQKQWYRSGERFKELTLVNGKEEGIQKAWRKNGKIFNNYEAKNGRIFGLKRSGLCYELENEEVQDSRL